MSAKAEDYVFRTIVELSHSIDITVENIQALYCEEAKQFTGRLEPSIKLLDDSLVRLVACRDAALARLKV